MSIPMRPFGYDFITELRRINRNASDFKEQVEGLMKQCPLKEQQEIMKLCPGVDLELQAPGMYVDELPSTMSMRERLEMIEHFTPEDFPEDGFESKPFGYDLSQLLDNAFEDFEHPDKYDQNPRKFIHEQMRWMSYYEQRQLISMLGHWYGELELQLPGCMIEEFPHEACWPSERRYQLELVASMIERGELEVAQFLKDNDLEDCKISTLKHHPPFNPIRYVNG